MSKHYKQKALLATIYKIQRIKKNSGFLKKNINKVIIVGALISFWIPFYSNESGHSMGSQLEMSYTESVVFAAVVILSLCIIAHISWTIQDKRRLKKLIKRKEELEEKIKSYDL